MAVVGISFGSPTSGQGFDVASTVSQITANLSAVETPWKNQLTSLKADDAALTSIGTDLASLSTSLQNLTDFQGVLAGKQGSSSDTNVLQLTSANTTAVAGSHTVVVQSLASTSSYALSAATASDVLNGSFAVTVGGAVTTIHTDPGGDTLQQLASNINAANAGVTASVLTTASGTRLSLVSSTSGAAGAITIGSNTLVNTTSGGTALAFSQTQPGVDAQLTVDGLSVTSPSNTVTGVIQGVTFQLLDAAPTTPVQVQITNDNSAVETAVGSLVTAYNKVVNDLSTQEGKDSSGNPEPLFGSPTVSQLQQALENALFFTQAAQSVGSSAGVGKTDTLSGSLSIQVGSGTSTTVAVDGSNPTLAGLAASINTANLGVTATVITSGSSATLSLVNSTGGAAGKITVDSSLLTDTTTGSGVQFGASQSNGVTSLTQLGLTVNNDGTLALNTDTLNQQLNSNYASVISFFQPSASFTSFGGNLTTVLNQSGNSSTQGTIYLALQQNANEEKTLNTNISHQDALIATQKAQLTEELNQANYALQQIPSQLNYVNELYSAITGYNTKRL